MLWVCVCSFRYTACNAHAPYFHLWPAPVYKIFLHYLINVTFFEKNLLNTKCVFWLPLQCLSETLLIIRKLSEIWSQVYSVLHAKYPLLLSDINKIWLFSAVFRKSVKCQISWKSLQWEPSCFMWKDGTTDMTKLIVAIRNFANTPKIIYNFAPRL
jgi:hypothetical protein